MGKNNTGAIESIVNINVDETDGNVNISTNDDVFGISFYTTTFYEEKDKIKFIKKVERLVRSSDEYRTFVRYLKDDLNFNHCSMLNTLNSDEVSVEMHHHPFTLYDITETVINEHVIKNQKFNSFSISNYVMELHYKNFVGLVPLSKTMHELIHYDRSSYKIPRELVVGNFDLYYQKNVQFMEEEPKIKYNNWLMSIQDMTEHDTKKDQMKLFDETKRQVQINNTSIYQINSSENLLEEGDKVNG